MPQLTDMQKRRLITQEPHININAMLNYILEYDNVSLDDFPNMAAERRQYIENAIQAMPNPQEKNEWEAIDALRHTPTPELLRMIEAYIRRWEGSRPNGNHVDEANLLYDDVDKQLKEQQKMLKEQQKMREQADWEQVDSMSKTKLLAHLQKYPDTVHKSDIDDSFWSLTRNDDIMEIQNYITLFPEGNHISEAQNILNSIAQWDRIKNSGDIFMVSDYINDNPSSPFKSNADILLMTLKRSEIEQMQQRPDSYEVSHLLKLLSKNIFTDRELIYQNVLTQNVLDRLRQGNLNNGLPSIVQAISQCELECKPGYTDVYFFGIPSTGKTCILMGLSSSKSLHINLAHGGGDYAAALQQYTSSGVTVATTPGNFVVTLEANIYSQTSKDVSHNVNLIEMSGEEFALQIAGNPDHIFTFEDMGSGTTELLRNDNRKVFFLIIDPTASVVRRTHQVTDANGNVRLETYPVNQQTVISKMVDLFSHSDNCNIMKKVDSIHIIITKADLLGDELEREEKALDIFRTKYQGIITPLIRLCEEYNINTQTDHRPKLYTFSLGKFYVGGLYEYDCTDSDRLVTAITNSTIGTKEKTFWVKFKELVNGRR